MSNQHESGSVPDASSGGEGKTSAEPKVIVADGVVTVDGIKHVKESDLIAAKRSLESQAEQAQTLHLAAIDSANLRLSESQKEIATLTARMSEMEQARQTGAATDEEVARVKAELEEYKTQMSTATSTILDMRRAGVVQASGGTVTAEQLADKTQVELVAFEEALKVVNKNSGPGNYVVGRGSGEGATPETPMERAGRILAATPFRGTRNAESV